MPVCRDPPRCFSNGGVGRVWRESHGLNMVKFWNFRKMVASIKPNLPWLSFGVVTETLALLYPFVCFSCCLRRRTLRVPSGVLFDTPELEKLLSASERQRLKAFKASMAETQPVPPASISVQDGRCAESAIGGGCKCVDDDCSQATWGQENHLDGRSYVCQRYGL